MKLYYSYVCHIIKKNVIIVNVRSENLKRTEIFTIANDEDDDIMSLQMYFTTIMENRFYHTV